MIVSVPLLTWGTLPDTGVSSICAPRPCSRTRSASSRLARGLIVLRSAHSFPAFSPATMPSGPDATDSDDVVVRQGGQDDVDRLGERARRGGPAQTLIDEPLRVLAVTVLPVDGVAGGEVPGGHVASHVSQADESDAQHGYCSPSMVVMSSSDSSRLAASISGSTCSGERNPTIAPSTAGVLERPSDGDGSRDRVVAVGHDTEALDQVKVARQLGLAEALVVLAPVIIGERLDPLAGHRPGQQSRAHRRVRDHADPVALGEREDPALDVALDQRVLRLERLHGRDLLDPSQLLDVEVRDADVADQSLLLELGERRPALLDVLIGDRPVDLVEVDRVDPQPLEAGVRLAQDRNRA